MMILRGDDMREIRRRKWFAGKEYQGMYVSTPVLAGHIHTAAINKPSDIPFRY